MSIKKLTSLLIISGVILQGCNSGSPGQLSEPNNATQQKLNSPTAKAQTLAAAGDDTPGYNRLPRTELGWGYDPTTNTVLPITSMDSTKLLNNYGEQEFNSGTSEFKSYAEYAQDVSMKTSADAQDFSGGIGVSYGLYSGSVKAAYSSSETSASGSLSINKAVGLAGTITNNIILNYNNISPKQASDVAEALYNTGGQSFQDSINAIRQAKDSTTRYLAVLNFYSNYGTHFISSVTKGYMGVANVTLTQKKDQGSEQSGKSVSASFSSPFVNAEANYSQANSSAFLKDQWNYSSTTFTTPDDSGIRDALTALKSDITTELGNQQGTLNLDTLKQYQDQASTAIRASMPSLSNITIVADPTAKASYEKQKTLREALIVSLKSLETIHASILKLVTSRDAAAGPERTTLNTQIMEQLGTDKPYATELNKFKTDGAYSGLALNSTQAASVNVYQTAFDTLQMNIDTKSQDILDKEKELKSAEERQKTLNENKVSYQAWLKDSVYASEKKGEQSYEDWLNSKSFEDLKAYDLKFNDYLKKQNYVPQDDNPQLKKLINKQRMLSQQQKLQSSLTLNSDNPGMAATLDFDIVPWATVFPELNSSAEFIGGAIDIIKARIIKKATYINDMRDYLLLCALMTNSDKLNRVYTNDSINNQFEPIKQLIRLIKSNGFHDKITFNSNSYDLNDDSRLAVFEADFNNVINGLSMLKDIPNWYQTTDKLMSKGLVAPQGVAVAINKFSSNMGTFSGLLTADPRNYDGFWTADSLNRYNSLTPITATYGQQLYPSLDNTSHKVVYTWEPIVTDSSSIVAGQATNLLAIDSNGKTTNKFNVTLTAEGDNLNNLFKVSNDPGLTPGVIAGGYISYVVFPFIPEIRDYLPQGAGGWVLNNQTMQWPIHDTKYAPVAFMPLDRFNTQSVETALGGPDGARTRDPRYKLYYSGIGSASSDVLYALQGLR